MSGFIYNEDIQSNISSIAKSLEIIAKSLVKPEKSQDQIIKDLVRKEVKKANKVRESSGTGRIEPDPYPHRVARP